MHFNAGMAAAEMPYEGRQYGLDALRAAADPQGAGQATSHCVGAVPQRIGLLQQAASAAYNFLAFGGEPEPAANPVKQWHAQFGFERLNLTRSCWLAEMQSTNGAGEATSVGDGDQGFQLAEIHRSAHLAFMQGLHPEMDHQCIGQSR